MFFAIQNGSVEVIQGYECQLPPVGWGKNRLTGELEHIGIIKNSIKPEDQVWKRIALPQDWEKKRKAEILQQAKDPEYYDLELEKIREKHWQYRLCGLWFYNNGMPTYIPGSFYMYLNWVQLDVGYPHYRDNDRKFFYVWEYCVEDQRCAGLVDIERRRAGKSYKAGSIVLDRTSLHRNHHGGIQSKTGPDARQLFTKSVVSFFKKFPDFFRPVYDKSKGITPTSELRFFQTTRKGRNAELVLEGDELESWIDFGTSELFHYDGSKLNTYISDEYGKCFSKGTRIRMHDGSVKSVEDICNGEMVMGNDSTPRVVSGTTTGREQIYRIVPNSGESWACNESHILCLKWANRSRKFRGFGFDEIVNISVKEFLQLSKHDQRHLMLWRTGVEYEEQQHDLEPYYLGAWLGDGNSNSAGYTKPDLELRDYMQDYAIKNNVRLVQIDEMRFNISGLTGIKGSNKILTALQKYNLINNKHIPEEYIIDSRENRLQLLAGLIDTDGYLILRNGNPAGYEITQKRKELSYQIVELARSLSFKATIIKAIAKMVRNDGTIYSCEVYRVCIFGDLFTIPCKISRKKAHQFEYHKNRRNPLKSGFKVEPIGEGQYYGFTVDGNHLFLLEDFTVVHNTQEVNVWDRWQVVKFCLDQDSVWIGKALFTTTIEEMENGGDNGLKIWDNSDPADRNENGRTKSGMYRFFLPAFETTFFDKHGIPEIEKAKDYYLKERAGLQHDPRALSAAIRKNPFTIQEAFRIDGDRCLYDSMKLNYQLDAISYKQNLITRGNFVWENGEPFTKVRFEKSSNGRWQVAYLFENYDNANQVVNRNGRYYPNNNFAFSLGCDPFKYDAVKDGRRSDCAAFVYKKHDVMNPTHPYNDAFVCYYCYRAVTTALANEDILKMAWYYGCQVLFERNVDHWRQYFHDHNCEGFLMKLPGEDDYGVYTDGMKKVHQLLADYTEAYINEHIEKVYFPGLIKDWLNFDLGKTTAYDTAMSAGFTLIAARDKSYQRKIEETRDVSHYFRMHKAG